MKFGRPSLTKLVLGASLVVLAVQLGLAYLAYGRLAVAALRFPFPLDYSEGPLLDQAVRLARGESIYPASFDTPPYTLATTPPLFQLLQAPLTRLFGPAYWYGRLMALLAAGAAAALIGLILQALLHDTLAAWMGALIFLAFPLVIGSSALARGDTLALAVSLAGLYVIVRAPAGRPPAPAALWLGGLLLVAAVYARQSYILAAPLTALVWLWNGRQRRAAVTLAAICAGSALALGIALNLATGGGLLKNLGFAATGPLDWEAVAGQWAGLYLNAGYLMFVCLIYVVVDPLGERSPAWLLLTAYLVGAALATAAVGQPSGSGADLLSLAAALGLGAGALLAWTGERDWLRASVILVLALQANQLATWAREDHLPRFAQKLSKVRDTQQLDELVARASRPVLADEFMGLLPLHGQRVYFQPYEYRQLAAAGRWEAAPLIAEIERQAFDAILLYQPRLGPGLATRWAPELRNAIYAHYESRQTLADTLVYLPRAAPPVAPASEP